MKNDNKQDPKINQKKLRRVGVSGISAVVLIILLAAAAWQGGWFTKDEEKTRSTFIVPEAGPLTISVTKSGTIRSEERVVLKNEVEGRTAILSLVPEGTRVKKGDLLIELDASELRDSQVEQEIRVQNSDAAFVGARENLEVVKNQTTADISKAELDVRFAREDLTMYKEGEYPKQVKELKAKIALAQEELQRARQTYEGSQVLYEEKYISQNELQADELAAKKAELDLELAQEELQLVEEYTHQRRLDELTAAVDQAEMALERVRRKAAADLVQAKANLRAEQAELKQQKDKLAKIQAQIDKTEIYAPRDGLVVYATSTQFSWRGDKEPLAEGQEVREREELIHLPANDQMMVQVSVPEAKLQLIKAGLPARITVDALPGREYRGHVKRIAPLPDATSVFLNPDLKVYDTDVLFDNTDAALRTGMSCTVEIVAARYDKALHVPLHAVTRQGLQPVVYARQKDNSFAPKPVEIGLDDNRLVHIKDGLSAGDVILLNPPMDKSAAPDRNAAAKSVAKSGGDTGRKSNEEADGSRQSGKRTVKVKKARAQRAQSQDSTRAN